MAASTLQAMSIGVGILNLAVAPIPLFLGSSELGRTVGVINLLCGAALISVTLLMMRKGRL